ncbi:uncharacterized protein LOC112972494 isoform X4 [Apteryx rowi]|uniref:uncharacterized protein LOC112972494 isoform X4 n=1 Tax=Apteryx rowi TaxID=308060 RepID=UPI000E1D363E|nr:uncharacterized protein LOC112972494 isoform X4 [Apteryx rowi]
MPLKSAHGPFSSLEILSQCSPASTVQGPHCSVPGRLFASAHGSWTRRWARPSVRPSQSSAKRGDVLRSLDLSESSTYLAGDLRSEAVAGAGQGGGLVDPVDALEAFSKHMENFSSLEVKRLSEHFLPDIIHVLESDLHSMLQDLTSVHLITARQAQRNEAWPIQTSLPTSAVILPSLSTSKDARAGSKPTALGLQGRLVAAEGSLSRSV